MARTEEELLKMGEMVPELEKAVQQRPVLRDPTDPRGSRAAHLQNLRQYSVIPGPLPEVEETERLIPTRDGTEIRIRIYTPQQPPGKGSPLIVMYHEGGWCMGDLSDEDLNCRNFCKNLGAVCINVGYRLAPEYPFPTGVNDSWDALQWAAANATSLSANPALGFIVGGGSAGGNITAVMTHLARDENLHPALTGQYLCVPALLPSEVVPEKYRHEYQSATTNLKDPVLGVVNTGRIYAAYKPDLSSPLFVPFNHPKGHKGVPPVYFQLCGIDPLLDDGLIYDRVLREEYGIDTRLDLYPGYGHMFWTNWPEMEMSRKFVDDTLEGVRWLLQRPRKCRES